MRLIRSRPLTVFVVAGALLVLVGGAWFAATGFGEVGAASFGWFTYAPTTPDVSFTEGIVVLSRAGAAALALLALGIGLLSAAAGYVLGRRTAPKSTPPLD